MTEATSPPTPVDATGRLSFARECRDTLLLALPLIAGQLGQRLMSVADAVMLGHAGIVPIGVATFADALVAVPFILGIGLLTSVSVRVANARGAGRPSEAQDTFRHGTWLALGYGLLVVVGFALLLPWLHLFGQDAEVAAATPTYLLILAASLVPALLSIAWKNHSDALGHPWPAFWIFLYGVLLNIGLNWLWIYGHWGFPAMGANGAALATLVARTAMAAAILLWILRSPRLRAWTPRRDWGHVTRGGFRRLLAIGVPTSFGLLTESAAFAISALVIGTFGKVPLAAHQVAITCAATTFMIPLGMAMALTVRIGALAGEQAWPRMHRVLAGGWLFGAGFMALSMLVFLFGGEWLAQRFVGDPAVIALSIQLLIVAGIFQLFDGLQVVSSGALRGFGDVRVPAWLALFAYWGLGLPVGGLLAYRWNLGAVGMWAGLAVGLGIAGLALSIRAWRRLRPPVTSSLPA
jgi:MATE family multidrug resistance protein